MLGSEWMEVGKGTLEIVPGGVNSAGRLSLVDRADFAVTVPGLWGNCSVSWPRYARSGASRTDISLMAGEGSFGGDEIWLGSSLMGANGWQRPLNVAACSPRARDGGCIAIPNV